MTDSDYKKDIPCVVFALGKIVATPNALEHTPANEIASALRRHASGDWGTLDREDWQANDQALLEGGRLLSVYDSSDERKFWIITEADRSVTTVLFPEDY